MFTRRELMVGAAATVAAPAHAAAVLTDDGLYRQPWFLDSFLELADDLDGAAKSGKRFAVMWELKGCPYCRETHLVNFARPDIEDYVKTNFEVLQLNIIGSRKVKDFDGSDHSREGARGALRHPLHADLPVLPRNRRGACRKAAAEPRSRARAGISVARRFPRALSVRAREGVRDQELSGLRARGAGVDVAFVMAGLVPAIHDLPNERRGCPAQGRA